MASQLLIAVREKRRMKSCLTLVVSACLLVLATAGASAVTLEELRSDPKLSPETFAHYFAGFKFVFGAEVQKPESFLAAEAGDCDDYSTLAAAELASRGYHPHLVAVRTKKMVHVVCYIEEARGYLDYEYRAKGSGLLACGTEVEDVADAVAKSLKAPWTSVSEFTYSDGVKRLVKTKMPKDRMTAAVNTKRVNQ